MGGSTNVVVSFCRTKVSANKVLHGLFVKTKFGASNNRRKHNSIVRKIALIMGTPTQKIFLDYPPLNLPDTLVKTCAE